MGRSWWLVLVCVSGCTQGSGSEEPLRFLRDPLSGRCLPVTAADARAPRLAGWAACPDPCVSLDEAACGADPRCAAPELQTFPPRFAGCAARPVEAPQPPFCTSSAQCAEESHCSVEDGDCGPLPAGRDARAGSAVCAGICLSDDGSPPPDPCAGLPEAVCTASIGCEAIRGGSPCASRDEACVAPAVYQGCQRAYLPDICLRHGDCGAGERCTAPSACGEQPICNGPAETCPAVCTGICVAEGGAPSPTACAPGDLPGTWTSGAGAGGGFERRYRFVADGTFTVEDLVAPCPPGVVCVWSGIVTNGGTWTETDGAVALEYHLPLASVDHQGFASLLSSRGCGAARVLAEAHEGRVFRRG
jgi:hypothetical protein